MSHYRFIHEYLLVDKTAKDVTNAILNSFNAFAADITYSLSSLDKELFVLKLTNQEKFKILDSYVTIKIRGTNQIHSQTELEFLVFYKSDESIYRAWFQKRKIRWAINNFLSEFKKRCEKWL